MIKINSRKRLRNVITVEDDNTQTTTKGVKYTKIFKKDLTLSKKGSKKQNVMQVCCTMLKDSKSSYYMF